MIQELLQQLKCSEKEIEVYLYVLKQGKTTPARIAKGTGINRSTVYVVLNKLKKNGLIVEDISSKILFYSASSSEMVEDMFYRQQEKLNKKKNIAKKLAEELEMIPQSKNYSIPKIRFVEEDDLEDFLYKNQKKWKDSADMEDGCCWGFQDHSFVENYQKWIDWAWKTHRMKVKLFSNESDIEKKLSNKFDGFRNIKFWSKNLDFSSSTWIMGDYLVMIITRQKPFYLVEINDAVLAHNLREVFKNIWNETGSKEKKIKIA